MTRGTFSGKTKFVIADSFIFECKGYGLHSSVYEKNSEKTSNTYSSKDYQAQQKLRDINH